MLTIFTVSLEDMTDVTGDDYISPIERENIQLEKDTWALVKHLYRFIAVDFFLLFTKACFQRTHRV